MIRKIGSTDAKLSCGVHSELDCEEKHYKVRTLMLDQLTSVASLANNLVEEHFAQVPSVLVHEFQADLFRRCRANHLGATRARRRSWCVPAAGDLGRHVVPAS